MPIPFLCHFLGNSYSANFNGFLYIFDFSLFQNKNKNHHISMVLYGMNNVSTAVYCMLVILRKETLL